MLTAARQAGSRSASQPITALAVRSSTTSSNRPVALSTNPDTNWVDRIAEARRNAVSSTPSAATSARRAGSLISGRPCRSTARITVCQPTP
jgi:hypothetical protein